MKKNQIKNIKRKIEIYIVRQKMSSRIRLFFCLEILPTMGPTAVCDSVITCILCSYRDLLAGALTLETVWRIYN